MLWRWREDSHPGDPETNMAVDAALLQELIIDDEARPIVRIYQWDRPSVSVGRLQSEDAVRCAFPGLPTVRRPTGGRAVKHGDDLTVTVAARESDLPGASGQSVLSSYRQIVSGVVCAFAALGIPAQLGREAEPQRERGMVDCFALAARCDVIHAGTGRKLAGCAQRRQDGVILQQMSLLMDGSSEEAAFVAALQIGLGDTLGVTEWRVVDTASPV